MGERKTRKLLAGLDETLDALLASYRDSGRSNTDPYWTITRRKRPAARSGADRFLLRFYRRERPGVRRLLQDWLWLAAGLGNQPPNLTSSSPEDARVRLIAHIADVALARKEPRS